MSGGYQLPAEGIVRGQPIVRPEEEWRERYLRLIRGRLLVNSTAFVLLMAVLFIPMSALGDVFLLGFFSFFLFLLYLIVFRTYSLTKADVKAGGPVPGLYANGIEMPIFPVYTARLFIPWTEMEDAWVEHSRLVDDMLFISVKGSRWRWRFPRRLLGEEGVVAAIGRVRRPSVPPMEPPSTVPPRLVLYTAEGARTESTPDEV